MTDIQSILNRKDCMSIEEGDQIATAMEASTLPSHIEYWLMDIIQGSGTDNEAKIAAIIRGLLLAKQKEGEV